MHRLAGALLLLSLSFVVPASAQAEVPPDATAPPGQDASADAALPEPPSGVTFTREALGEYIEYARIAYEEAGIPGMAMALVQSDGEMAVVPFGERNARSGDLVTLDTRFALGEATAALTSLLAATATTADTVDWDDPVRRLGPDRAYLSDSPESRVSLRHLLKQTGGIATHLDAILAREGMDGEDLLSVLSQASLTDAPGTRHQPSSASVALAGYRLAHEMAEADDNEALEPLFRSVMRERLLEPAGMQGVVFSRLELLQTRDYAVGHAMSRSGGDWVPEPTFQADNLALLPARGARVRIVDVAVWLSLEMRAGLSVYNIPLASRRELEARWHADSRRTPPRPTPGFLETYEMGRPLLVAIGAVDNQSALVAILPEHRCALAVLTNAPPPATQALLRDLLVNFIEMSEAADQADVDEPTVEEVALPETD